MVYTELNIVAGVVLTDEERAKFEEETEMPPRLHENLKKYVYIPISFYGSKCCGKKETVIFGIVVHTYYRSCQRCEKCDKYTVCDTCIGQTNNGNYDVDKMSEFDVKVERRHLCPNCFADNGSVFEFCKTCNHKFDKIPRSYDKWLAHVPYLFVLEELLSIAKINKKPDFYYALNDCLSCT